jgi:hypothetical protein
MYKLFRLDKALTPDKASICYILLDLDDNLYIYIFIYIYIYYKCM